MSNPSQPLSTYRVQLHAGFTLKQLHEQLEYLQALGIDWIYASPVLAAVPGSTHGYDVIDVNKLNPELGTEAEWRALHGRRKELGLGWLQDIVPNHMAYDLANPWIHELLRHGEASTVARHFDINWRHPDYRGKVMLPILGAPVSEVIDEGQISVDVAAQTLQVYDKTLPLSAKSLSRLPTNGEVDVASVLDDQHYRLAYWKDTNSQINFRRFFTVNGLICLLQERPDTFAATHQLIFAWLKAGDIDGLRLDHIDGLLDPTGYLRKLRDAVGEDAYIVAEKILEQGEHIPEEWPIQGTTGYDFLAFANQMLRDPAGNEVLASVAASFDESPEPLEDTIAANKRWTLTERMAGELDNVLHHAQGALAGLPLGLDTELLRDTLTDWLSAFPVYRAYPRMGNFKDRDRAILVDAAERAMQREGANTRGLEMLRAWLRSITRLDDKTITFLQRAMQLSGPLMAKGIEDTTFYQRFEYLACNEVGDSPAPAHGLSISEYHDRMAERSLSDLNTTSTHDTKRAEDARARLHVMSARPHDWAAFAKPAGAYIDKLGIAVPKPVCYLLLQTLVSSWPSDGSGNAHKSYEQRLHSFAEKALRESKVYSNWAEPNSELEANVNSLISSLLSDTNFVRTTQQYVDDAEPFAWLNTLRALTLKCTAPGAPDVYQGTEYHDYSLVDPDNRRPVDYAARSSSLSKAEPKNLFAQPSKSVGSDIQKQQVLSALLHARNAWADLWRNAQYVPLTVTGSKSDEVLAYRRVHGDDSALVLIALRTDAAESWPCGDYFNGNTVSLPKLGRVHDILTQSQLEVEGETKVSDLLSQGPVAVFLPAR